jgi:hypothetical protein
MSGDMWKTRPPRGERFFVVTPDSLPQSYVKSVRLVCMESSLCPLREGGFDVQ